MSQAVLVPLDCKKHSLHVQVSLALTTDIPGLAPQPVKPVAVGVAVTGVAATGVCFRVPSPCLASPPKLYEGSSERSTALTFC
jgi:hypothetical protein